MATLVIDDGSITLDIEDGFGNIRGQFTFNPQDSTTLKKLISLQGDINKVATDIENLEGLTPEEEITYLDDTMNAIRNKIDYIYGDGSCEVLFGKSNSPRAFEQFVSGIIPYYQVESEKRTSKYTKKYVNK